MKKFLFILVLFANSLVSASSEEEVLTPEMEVFVAHFKEAISSIDNYIPGVPFSVKYREVAPHTCSYSANRTYALQSFSMCLAKKLVSSHDTQTVITIIKSADFIAKAKKHRALCNEWHALIGKTPIILPEKKFLSYVVQDNGIVAMDMDQAHRDAYLKILREDWPWFPALSKGPKPLELDTALILLQLEKPYNDAHLFNAYYSYVINAGISIPNTELHDNMVFVYGKLLSLEEAIEKFEAVGIPQLIKQKQFRSYLLWGILTFLGCVAGSIIFWRRKKK